MIILLIIAFVVVFMYFYPIVIFYSVILVLLVLLISLAILINSFIGSLPLLLIVVIYIGAIIILIGYVSSVSPNLYPTSFSFGSWFWLIFVGLLVPLFESVITDSVDLCSNFSLFYYFFSYTGGIIFGLLVFFIFLLLVVSSSLCIYNSPFRSVGW